MKLYINNFWPGFLEKTDANHIQFFLNLFEKIYSEKITVTDNISTGDILLESVCGFKPTALFHKKWTNTYLFSGEHHTNQYGARS